MKTMTNKQACTTERETVAVWLMFFLLRPCWTVAQLLIRGLFLATDLSARYFAIIREAFEGGDAIAAD